MGLGGEEDGLDALCEAAGFDLFEEYVNIGKSGGESRSSAEALQQRLVMLASLQPTSTVSSEEDRAASRGTAEKLAQTPFCDADLLRVYEEGCACVTLVVSFGGLVQGENGFQGDAASRHEFVTSCRLAGATHALFVRDQLQSWYLRVGADISDDAFCSLLALVSLEIERLRPSRLVMIGSSMGGYAALRAGLALNASAVLAFAPQVFIDPREREALELPVSGFDGWLAKVKHACEEAQIRTRSLVDLLKAPTVPRESAVGCQIDIHVGACARGDCDEAWLLEEACRTAKRGAAVVVQVHPRYGHYLAGGLRAEGKLEGLLRQLICSTLLVGPESGSTR